MLPSKPPGSQVGHLQGIWVYGLRKLEGITGEDSNLYKVNIDYAEWMTLLKQNFLVGKSLGQNFGEKKHLGIAVMAKWRDASGWDRTCGGQRRRRPRSVQEHVTLRGCFHSSLFSRAGITEGTNLQVWCLWFCTQKSTVCVSMKEGQVPTFTVTSLSWTSLLVFKGQGTCAQNIETHTIWYVLQTCSEFIIAPSL